MAAQAPRAQVLDRQQLDAKKSYRPSSHDFERITTHPKP
jgi:hypothetical protein